MDLLIFQVLHRSIISTSALGLSLAGVQFSVVVVVL